VPVVPIRRRRRLVVIVVMSVPLIVVMRRLRRRFHNRSVAPIQNQHSRASQKQSR
jgi:hypothetical protein